MCIGNNLTQKPDCGHFERNNSGKSRMVRGSEGFQLFSLFDVQNSIFNLAVHKNTPIIFGLHIAVHRRYR